MCDFRMSLGTSRDAAPPTRLQALARRSLSGGRLTRASSGCGTESLDLLCCPMRLGSSMELNSGFWRAASRSKASQLGGAGWKGGEVVAGLASQTCAPERGRRRSSTRGAAGDCVAAQVTGLPQAIRLAKAVRSAQGI